MYVQVMEYDENMIPQSNLPTVLLIGHMQGYCSFMKADFE